MDASVAAISLWDYKPLPEACLEHFDMATRRVTLPMALPPDRQIAEANLDRYHHLRHTYATLALGSGVPVHVVSRILGHSKPSITLDIYTGSLNSVSFSPDGARIVSGSEDYTVKVWDASKSAPKP